MVTKGNLQVYFSNMSLPEKHINWCNADTLATIIRIKNDPHISRDIMSFILICMLMVSHNGAQPHLAQCSPKCPNGVPHKLFSCSRIPWFVHRPVWRIYTFA